MTASRISLRSQHLVLAAVVALTVACKASESGAIPCNADSNCPSTYPQCVGGAGSSAGHCTEPVVGTPVLSPTTIAVTPAAITGGLHPTLSLALPALSGTKGLARTVTLGISVGGANEPVNKSGGLPVTLADLGTTITVDAPATAASDSKLLTYTLTVSNKPSSAAVVIATGTLSVVPAPVLATSSFAITPGSMTGGTSPTLSVALPVLSTPAAAVSSVSFDISGCGSGAVVKMSGAAVDTSDLGTTISIAAPVSTATDNKTCTYTLTVNSAATTPVSAIAVGTLAIAPLPVISASSFAVAPAVISGGLTPTLTATLPTLTSALAPGTTVEFTISGAGCGSGAVAKAAGGAVGLADLGTTISFTAPASASTDNSKTCTYTLAVTSASTVSSATGTLIVVPAPLLASPTVAPAVISGGSTGAITLTLPALASPAGSAATAGLTLSGAGCGPSAVTKAAGGTVTVADLGQAIAVAPPSTAPTDTLSCTYTLTVSNGATPPVSTTATGALTVLPAPMLGSATVTVSPASITGGSTAGLSIGLPGLTSGAASMSTATLLISGSGCIGPVVKTGGGAVQIGTTDVKSTPNTVTVVPPSSGTTDSLTCKYTLTVSNGATPPGSIAATGTLTVLPAPVLDSATVTVSPASIAGGSTAGLSLGLPGLTSGAASMSTATLLISGAGCIGPVVKTGGGAVQIGTTDVKSAPNTVTVVPPLSGTTDNLNCKYTLTVSNSATTPSSAAATGTLTVVGVPVFSGPLSVTPNVILGGTSPQLKFALPALTSGGAATSIAMTVTPPGTPVTKTGSVALVPTDLGKTVSVDPPTTTASAPKAVFNYSLTATNSSGTSTPATISVTSMPAGGDLGGARVGATATLLPNGKVLIVGGGTAINSGACTGATNTAEVYDPSTGVSVSAGTTIVNRCLHTAVLAGNNKVYVMGGANDARIDVFVYSASASPWGAWQVDATTALPTLTQVRVGHSATLLGAASNGGTPTTNNVGKIAVVGGYDPSNANRGLTNLEMFDPTGNGSSLAYSYNGGTTTNLTARRGEHAAVLIAQYLFLIGGFDSTDGASATADILDTARRVDSGIAPSQIAGSGALTNAVGRMGLSAIAIDSATILVAGGSDGTSVLKSMQKYTLDSTAGKGVVTGVAAAQNMATARARFPLLAAGPANKFLALGGTNSLGTPDVATSSVEIIDTSGTLSPSSGVALKSLRQALTATNLNLSGASNFAFLVAGGAAAAGGAEIYIGP